MENTSKINGLEAVVAIFKGVLSVAKIIVSAVLVHTVMYIMYLAVAGSSIKNGALINPNAENFVQFNSSVLMVVTPIILFCIVGGWIISKSVYTVSYIFGTMLVTLLAYYYGPYYDVIPAPNLFLISVVLWCVLPFLIKGLSELIEDTLVDDFESGEDYAVTRLQKLESAAYNDTKTGSVIYKTWLHGFKPSEPTSSDTSSSVKEPDVDTSESLITSDVVSENASNTSSEVAIWNTPLVTNNAVSSENSNSEQSVSSVTHPVGKDTIEHLENVLSAKFGGAEYVEPDKVDDMLDSAIREQNHEDVLESIAKYKETSHRRYGAKV